MSLAPLRTAERGQLGRSPVPPAPVRRTGAFAGRRRMVAWGKRLLPLLAVLLLATVMLWPQIERELDTARLAQSALHGVREGHLLNVRYHGLDGRNRPYTVTSEEAQQVGADRVNLVSPKADVLSESGAWTLVVAENGVFLQHANQLDLSGHVVMYRDNGVTLSTPAATVDFKAGAAAGYQATHAEGPFGTLDAQGFALVDKGNVVQFDGKSRLVLNEQSR